MMMSDPAAFVGILPSCPFGGRVRCRAPLLLARCLRCSVCFLSMEVHLAMARLQEPLAMRERAVIDETLAFREDVAQLQALATEHEDVGIGVFFEAAFFRQLQHV